MEANGQISMHIDETHETALYHPLFAMKDILDHICSFADKDVLCTLARTSRNFQDSAFRELYNYCDRRKLIHILRAFFPEQTFIKTQFYRKGPRWQRFAQYMKQIRHLSISDPGQLGRFRETFMIVISNSPSSPIIPLLRSLDIVVDMLEDYALVLGLLRVTQPLLYRFALRCEPGHTPSGTWEPALLSVLALLPSRCPDLRCLVIKTAEEMKKEFRLSFTAALSQLVRLEEFEAWGLRETELAAISGVLDLPRLKAVRLGSMDTWDDMVPQGSQPLSAFTALRRLHLLTFSYLLAAIATSCSSCDLIDINVRTWAVNSQFREDIREFSEILPRFSQLLQFDFDVWSVSHPDMSDDAQAWEALSPVLTCRLLQEFRFSNQNHEIPFQDDNIETMALSWPDLRQLQLKWCCWKGSLKDRSPGLQSLASLQAHCRHIQTISLDSLRIDRDMATICLPKSMWPHGIDFSVGHCFFDAVDPLAALLVAGWSNVALNPSRPVLDFDETDQANQWIELCRAVGLLREYQLERGQPDTLWVSGKPDVHVNPWHGHIGNWPTPRF